MKLHPRANFRLSILILLYILLFNLPIGYAEEQNRTDSQMPQPYIELTESFYRALQNDSAGEDRIYGNTGKSDDYLRQIAISTRFMVETNMQIIRQQEKMIELLEAMSIKRGK